VAYSQAGWRQNPAALSCSDPEHRIRTELTNRSLAGRWTSSATWAARQTIPSCIRRCPAVQGIVRGRRAGKLVLTSFVENYQVDTAKTDHAAALANTNEFLDCTSPGHAVGAVHRRSHVCGSMPRWPATMYPPQGRANAPGDKQPVRAEHEFTWRLSREDMSRSTRCASRWLLTELCRRRILQSTQPQGDADRSAPFHWPISSLVICL